VSNEPLPGRGTGNRRRGLPVLVVAAVLLAVLVKTFLVQVFFIPSGSMERTLHGCPGCNGDRVVVNKVLYKVRDVRRGEIVVFNGVDSFTGGRAPATPATGLQGAVQTAGRLVGLGAAAETDYIKRVIGLPGDRVACCSNGHVTVQSASQATPVELHEPYLFEDDHEPFCAAGRHALCPPGSPGVLVPPGRLWVMGDHRAASGDSRDKGTIPADHVIGRAVGVVWPLPRMQPLRVPPTLR
jgi:signal peptidase I